VILIPTEDTGQEGRKPRKSAARGGKTSKTARVLGLLTNSAASEEPAVPEAYPPAAPAAPAVPAAPVVSAAPPPAPPAASIPFAAPLAPAPPVAEVQIDDKLIEAQIRNALEEELKAVEQELKQEAEQTPLTGEPLPTPETLSENPEAETPEPEMDLADRSDFSQMPQREDLSIRSGDPDAFCFNIMQALVEAKADKYIRLFGLCTCSRCRIDVIALSLSNLPAKYMVVSNKDIVPLLSTYEARYNAAIVSQVMSACRKVMEQPRHKPS